jgi:2-polyprenyl-3-methyl-5-hydroxy-6-metoxy-1,4-benzoquinol methylase
MKDGNPVIVAEKNTKVACWFTAYRFSEYFNNNGKIDHEQKKGRKIGMRDKNRICPVENAGGLDNGIRRWLQNPRKILGPYINEGMTTLDFGCGPGFFTIDMAKMVGKSGRVIACDLQDGMLEKLRAKIKGSPFENIITLHKCQKDRIGVTETVDFILVFYMLHEVPNQDNYLRAPLNIQQSA